MKQIASRTAFVTQISCFDVTPKLMGIWQNFLATL